MIEIRANVAPLDGARWCNFFRCNGSLVFSQFALHTGFSSSSCLVSKQSSLDSCNLRRFRDEVFLRARGASWMHFLCFRILLGVTICSSPFRLHHGSSTFRILFERSSVFVTLISSHRPISAPVVGAAKARGIAPRPGRETTERVLAQVEAPCRHGGEIALTSRQAGRDKECTRPLDSATKATTEHS